jgi:hypothetical protein
MGSYSLDSRPHRSGGPLLSRAWCLQEDLLSKRKLYYASDQLYWECDHLAVSEDGLADPELAPSFSASSSLSNANEPESAVHASRHWYARVIGWGYSQRVATMANDRLIAVAGLARHAANTIKSRYVAGLWENHVLEAIWIVAPKVGVRSHKFTARNKILVTFAKVLPPCSTLPARP